MKHYYKGMLGVHLENGTVSIRSLPTPARPEGYALLRLLAGGIWIAALWHRFAI